jgi:hypothetical protein
MDMTHKQTDQPDLDTNQRNKQHNLTFLFDFGRNQLNRQSMNVDLERKQTHQHDMQDMQSVRWRVELNRLDTGHMSRRRAVRKQSRVRRLCMPLVLVLQMTFRERRLCLLTRREGLGMYRLDMTNMLSDQTHWRMCRLNMMYIGTDRRMRHMCRASTGSMMPSRVEIGLNRTRMTNNQMNQERVDKNPEHKPDMWRLQGLRLCILASMAHMQIVRFVVVLFRLDS